MASSPVAFGEEGPSTIKGTGRPEFAVEWRLPSPKNRKTMGEKGCKQEKDRSASDIGFGRRSPPQAGGLSQGSDNNTQRKGTSHGDNGSKAAENRQSTRPYVSKEKKEGKVQRGSLKVLSPGGRRKGTANRARRSHGSKGGQGKKERGNRTLESGKKGDNTLMIAASAHDGGMKHDPRWRRQTERRASSGVRGSGCKSLEEP